MATILYYHHEFIRPIVPMALAKYFKSDIKFVHIDDAPEDFEKDFPLMQSPNLINKETGLYLTEAIAVYHYILNTYCKDKAELERLQGSNVLEESEILRWESFSVSDFILKSVDYIYPLAGRLPFDAAANEKAKDRFAVFVQIYEDQLKKQQYLVGDHLTLADLVAVGSFYLGYKLAFDAKWEKQYPNIARWYKEVTNSPYVVDFFKDKKQVASFPEPPK